MFLTFKTSMGKGKQMSQLIKTFSDNEYIQT